MMESQTGLVVQCRLREPYSDASATVWVGWDIAGHHHHHHYHHHRYRGRQIAQMGVGFLIALPAALALMLIAEKVGCLAVWTFHRPSCERRTPVQAQRWLDWLPLYAPHAIATQFCGLMRRIVVLLLRHTCE